VAVIFTRRQDARRGILPTALFLDREGCDLGAVYRNQTDDLRITRVFPCIARGFKSALASCSQVAAVGDHWLFGDVSGTRASTAQARFPVEQRRCETVRFQAGHIPGWRGSRKRYVLMVAAKVAADLDALVAKKEQEEGCVTTTKATVAKWRPSRDYWQVVRQETDRGVALMKMLDYKLYARVRALERRSAS
jgi:hypothetical protein